MRVKELIEQLQKLPPDAFICIRHNKKEFDLMGSLATLLPEKVWIDDEFGWVIIETKVEGYF